ncbi:hypothetical protein RCG23_24575 [Neobacillus sp. PS3-34]|uniref:hypothetical protein n=1 Tax=Neobacillus sp. PS3-34 TaxID=3070678 RepID=UPI0027E0DB93|nr:hypothetical protein [Neobacillus sp. PS3-34]WML48376.1 hypothetical protein RCG23_24575 [Neobacillus sp. PS3-34]
MFNSLTHSFRARFTITTVTIVMILTFVLSTFISSFSSEEIKSEIGTSLSQNAYQTSDKLENFMWARSGEVELLSKLSALKNPNNPKKIRELVEQLRASIPFYSWIGFMDPQGDVLASTDGILTGKNLSQRPVYQEALKGHLLVMCMKRSCLQSYCHSRQTDLCDLSI